MSLDLSHCVLPRWASAIASPLEIEIAYSNPDSLWLGILYIRNILRLVSLARME